MRATFGNTELNHGARAACLHINLAAGPLELNWQHCGTTSDFLGDYFAIRCKGHIDQANVRHSIGYLINEILENAVKFRHAGNVDIRCSLDGDRFVSEVSNVIDRQTATRFQAVLKDILSRDANEMLLERIEANAADESRSGSGLGILTLLSDYEAELGWNFMPDKSRGLVNLKTVAALTLA